MQNITPHLWFDTEAGEAAAFYASVFEDSEVTNVTTLHDTPGGECDVVSFNILGHPFMAISAGPLFEINPSVSFLVNFDPSRDKEAKEKLDAAWEKLIDGGMELMPLDVYPFSKRYGWVQDKYGVSWQLILTAPEGEKRPAIVPSLMFVGNNAGKAEEAIDFYLSVFKNAKPGMVVRHPEGAEPEAPGTVMFADFMIENTWLAALDSARDHNFTFNEAVSFMVSCDTQEEIDEYWERLSAVPEAEQCGWVKDQYGLSWQIVPAVMGELMKNADEEKRRRVTQAMLQMKKLDIEKLKAA